MTTLIGTIDRRSHDEINAQLQFVAIEMLMEENEVLKEKVKHLEELLKYNVKIIEEK